MSELNPNLIPPAKRELEDFLSRRLKGQPQAIEVLAKAYANFKSGMGKFTDQDSKKPIGVFLFLGPSRTGKTEAGRLLGQFFHGTKKAVALIDCVSYQEKHEIAKLIGAPPGYIGFDQKPLLSKEKLQARIPGYQTAPSVNEFKSNKKEERAEDDDDTLETKDIFSYWLNRLNLIKEGLRNINRRFSQLQNLTLSQTEREKIKKDLKTQRIVLQTSRDFILNSFTELTLQLLENWNQTQTPPQPIGKNGNNSDTKKVKPAPEVTAKSTPVNVVVKKEPIMVIIFDEIEKAHDSIRQFLLQLMEEGHAVLGNHEEVDLSRSFIILTSNIGSKLISKATRGVVKIGFEPSTGKENLEKFVKAELKKLFSQEFLNRLDGIVTFNILSPQDFKEILELAIEELTFYLVKIPLELTVSQSVKDFILEEAAKNPEEQVKSLQDCFKKYLTNPIGNLLATGQLIKQKKLAVTFDSQKKQVIFKT